MKSRTSTRLFLVFAILLTALGGTAVATLPSGNGRTTMAKSVSVVIASDQAAVPVSGTITVDTSALATNALQTTGNTSLSTIATNTGAIPAKGTAAMAASTPVTIATDDTVSLKLTQPTTSAAVTASDSTVLACGKGLWVGTAGNLSLKLSGDSSAVTWSNVPSGMFVPGNVIRVMAATTATNVVCLN